MQHLIDALVVGSAGFVICVWLIGMAYILSVLFPMI